jgi:tetratricopeptide (TPR) repeat protein
MEEQARPAEAGAKDFPVRLVEAGEAGIKHSAAGVAGSHLLPASGNFSCPALWDHAQGLFNDACRERDNKEHHRKLMEAGQAFVQVVLATGDFPVEKSFALNNVGLIMQALNRMDEAEKAFAFGLQMNPEHPTIMQNFATVRMVKGDLKGANEWFYKALERDPKCAEARWNSALIALTFGDFRRGFINYEWRWKCGTFTWRKLKTKRPQWNGQDLKGKTILLTHEQGLGDSIQFIRYAKMVKARGAARVRYLCLPELVEVLRGVDGIDEIKEFADINRDGTAGDEDFDYHCPLLSLPRILKTRVETVPWDGPYVKISGRGEAPLLGDKLRVGIVWAGRKEHANDMNRSMRLEDFAPLFDVPGVIWYSLQKGEREKDLARLAKDHEWAQRIYAPPIKSFTDTAWWLNELDLLISVDTAAVHLAGAMGRPVWALLPYSADWRWMTGRSDSPWYPSMTLYRQLEKGNWLEVVNRVKGEISKTTTLPDVTDLMEANN